MHSAERIFHTRYYTETAHRYNEMHVSEHDEHAVALRYMGGLLTVLGLRSILDVGTGTGRAVVYLQRAYPGMRVVGTELIPALLERAVHEGQVARNSLICASGYGLPFDDGSFDAVCAFGMLHHVKDPELAVDEMMRVARRAIFLSDGNRFGQGALWARVIKLGLARAGLWGVANFLKNRGRSYNLSAGDGLSYSYSVFDSFDRLARWADRIILVPTQSGPTQNWIHPLLTSSHVLLCAVRENARSRLDVGT